MVMTTMDSKSAQVGFSYDPVGRLSSLTRTANEDPSTTINTNYALDLLDRVTSITHQKVAGEVATTLSAFTYGYDANGRVVSSTGPKGSLSFAFDADWVFSDAVLDLGTCKRAVNGGWVALGVLWSLLHLADRMLSPSLRVFFSG